MRVPPNDSNPITAEAPQQDTPEELIRLQCNFYRAMNALLPQPTADRLGDRLANISQGAYMPSAGFGDASTMAGLLGLSYRAMQDQLAKTKPKQFGFGRAMLYSLATWFLAERKPKAKAAEGGRP